MRWLILAWYNHSTFMPGVAAILYLWRFQACCFLTSSAWVLLPTAKGSGFLGVKQVRDCWYYLIWWESKVTAPLSSPSPAHPAAGGQPWGVLPAVPLGNRVYVAWGRPAGACWDHQRVTEHLQGFLWVTYIRRTTPQWQKPKLMLPPATPSCLVKAQPWGLTTQTSTQF